MLPMNDTKRRIVIAFKTSGDKPEKGDRITEIACVEMMGLEKTGNNYQTFVYPGKENMEKCKTEYLNCPRLRPDTKAAEYTIYAMKRAPGFTGVDAEFIESEGMPEYLIDALLDAPRFHEIENDFMNYLRMYPDTMIVTHDIGRLKRFMKHEMSEENWKEFSERFHDPKHGMMQKARKFRQAGLFPESNGAWSKGLSFDAICTHFNVSTEGRTRYSAMQDALMLAAVVKNRKDAKMENIEMFPESKSYPIDMDTDSEIEQSPMRMSM